MARSLNSALHMWSFNSNAHQLVFWHNRYQLHIAVWNGPNALFKEARWILAYERCENACLSLTVEHGFLVSVASVYVTSYSLYSSGSQPRSIWPLRVHIRLCNKIVSWRSTIAFYRPWKSFAVDAWTDYVLQETRSGLFSTILLSSTYRS